MLLVYEMSKQVLPTAPSPTVTHLINLDALISPPENPFQPANYYLNLNFFNPSRYATTPTSNPPPLQLRLAPHSQLNCKNYSEEIVRNLQEHGIKTLASKLNPNYSTITNSTTPNSVATFIASQIPNTETHRKRIKEKYNLLERQSTLP